ncbi:MAG TPA: Mur ligase family protein, partial [Patescibacteria group bacterium]|nr:Mur ligase family protein [Patescibacteria group bacterium]
MKFDLSEFAGKDVVFVGVGQGRSVAGFQTYLEQHADIKSFERVDKEDGAEALAFLRDYDPSQTIFVKNEAIPGPEMPVPYITPLQLFFRLAQDNQLTTVGITGTKGKSTTAALTAHILETAGKSVVLAGNIGVSPLPALSEASPETIFVLELSSYQLSDLKTSPHISACINLYNDHAPWHGSQEAYWEAKHNIMRFAGADDVFIYNPSFPTMQQWATEATCHTVAIDPAEPLDLRDAQLYGDHNRLNALVAREIARQFKVADDVSHSALRSFQPLAHRMQTIVVKDGHTYIDDAIGMTPESTLASLKAVTEHVGPIGCLLLGGQDRDYDFKELLQNVADYKIPALVLFPNTQAKMKAALPA